MNTQGVCPIGCEHAIRSAWHGFGLEEAQHRQGEAAPAPTPGPTQGQKGEPSSSLRRARRRWVTKLKSVTPCRGRHWPSTPEEAGQLKTRLHWGSSDMWSAVDDAGANRARKPAHREGEQRAAQAPAPESTTRRREASQPTPVPLQRQAANPPASDDEGPRSDSEPVLFIQLPLVCLRPLHQGIKWDLLYSERARKFAVKNSLILFREFQAMMWERVQQDADAYLSKPPTERSIMESQRATEDFHHQLAKNLYKQFETEMKRKLADIRNGVPDDNDLVDNPEAEDIDSPDVEEDHQSGKVDETDRIRMSSRSNEQPISEGHRMNNRQTEEQQSRRSARPRTMPPSEPARRPDTDQEATGHYPPGSADIRHTELRNRQSSVERPVGPFPSEDWNSRTPQPGPAAASHRQERAANAPVNPVRRQRGESHHRAYDDNAYGVRPPPTQFFDPTYEPAGDHRQRRPRSASASGDPRPQMGPDAEATGSRYQYPSFPQQGRNASELNSARAPPPKARPDSTPVDRRAPPRTMADGPSYGSGFRNPTPLRYMPTTMEDTVPSEFPDGSETTDSDAANLHWLDQYCSDQYIADQYTDVANTFKESELDQALSKKLSKAEEGRLQSNSNAQRNAQTSAPAAAPMRRSGVAPQTPRVPNMAVPPLVASEESNTDSDSDATVSDLTIQSESESDETPTQSAYSSPLASVRIPEALSSFAGQRPRANASTEGRQSALRMTASRQAAGMAMKSERREVHFAEEPAVRYFRG